MTAPDLQAKQREGVEPASQVEPSARDPIAEWLAVFGRTLAVPKAEAREILDELEDHLRTRVDDLLIAGHSEPEATRRAVGELGETVALAKGFREARTHMRRRLVMQVLTISAAAVAVTISAWTAMAPAGGGAAGAAGGGGASGGAVVASGAGGGGVGVLLDGGDPTIERLRLEPQTLREAFEEIAAKLGRTALVRWNDLAGQGSGRDLAESEVGPMSLGGLTLSQAIDKLLADSFHLEASVAYRLTATTLEIASIETIDEEARVLREYSMGEIDLGIMDLDQGRLVRTITEFVEPEGWAVNGGVWTMSTLGTLVVVDAPPRAHEGVSRMLESVREESRRITQHREVEAEQRRVERLREKEREVIEHQRARDLRLGELRDRLEALRQRQVELQVQLGRLQSTALEGGNEGQQAAYLTLDAELSDVRAFREAVRERLMALELDR